MRRFDRWIWDVPWGYFWHCCQTSPRRSLVCLRVFAIFLYFSVIILNIYIRYGAMVPFCVLDVAHVAYISLQQHGGRWSDQWFSVPRKLASTFMRLLKHSKFHSFCSQGKLNLGISKHTNIGFEEMIFEKLNSQARRLQLTVTPLFLPRILARDNPEEVSHISSLSKENLIADIQEKCERFMPDYVHYCSKMVIGKTPLLNNLLTKNFSKSNHVFQVRRSISFNITNNNTQPQGGPST